MTKDEEEGAALATVIRSVRLEAAVPTGFQLLVVAGPDQGKTFDVSHAGGRMLIGASPACAIQLADPAISRRHASVEVLAEGLRFQDLESRNGSFVGTIRVRDAVLEGSDDLIRLGETTLRVARSPGSSAAPLDQTDAFGALVGGSVEMRRLYPICKRLAASSVPVIIEGETGTGKEVLAESIHDASARATRPFVVFDCTAVPHNLIEAALFGHERGAFTSASTSRAGVFEEADGGTLLIDEIGDLDLALQAKLLRAIQKSEIRRIGASKWTRVDVRVLAATRRDLDKEVQSGRFRDDLFFRLAVARIELPPLRERRSDIERLARHFWRELGGENSSFPTHVLQRLEHYSWPGNVRELQNVIAQVFALGDYSSSPVGRSSRPDLSASIEPLLDLPFSVARGRVLEDFEKRYLTAMLERHGNVARAAKSAGIAPRYFRFLRARSGTP